MKNHILELINETTYCTEHNRKCLAQNITNIFESFNKWKELNSGFGLIQNIDEVLYVNFIEGSKKKYTFAELFTYWYENIKDKK